MGHSGTLRPRGGGGGKRHGGLAALRGRGGHRRAERALPRQGRPHRRAVLPHRGRGGPRRAVAGRGRDRTGVDRGGHRSSPPPRGRGDLPGGGGAERGGPRGDLRRRDRPARRPRDPPPAGHGPCGRRGGRADGASRAAAVGSVPPRGSMTPGAGLWVANSSVNVNVSAGDVALLVVVLVLLAASAMLALAETSLVRMSRAKAMALVDDGRRGAKVLVRLTENPQGFLNPLLLLVLICQLVVATLVGVLAASWFGAWGVLAATVFEIVVIFVLGEAVPKNWAVHHPERAALLSAPLVSALVGFWPIR